MIKSFITAFSMYSKIPMPKVEWDQKSMKYAMCFFPCVGVVIGIISYIVGQILLKIECPNILSAAIMAVIPIIISGGIHMDGYLDTMDALGSWGDKEKKLEIMKDSHSGAFAIIGGLVYFTLLLGVWSAMSEKMLAVTSVVYILSRTLNALSIVSFPTAKNTGLAALFANAAHKRNVRIVMIIWMIISVLLMIYINIVPAIVMLIAVGSLFLYHYKNCMKNFGGITGDLAGFFLQLTELILPMVCVITILITG